MDKRILFAVAFLSIALACAPFLTTGGAGGSDGDALGSIEYGDLSYEEDPAGSGNVKVVNNWSYWSFSEKDLTIPSKFTYNDVEYTVTGIGDNAFQSIGGIRSVTIPSTVTYIGSYAFQYCKISDIEIPSSVTSIGDYAFEYCQISDIEIPSSVTSIGEYAFGSCPIVNANILSDALSIGNYAFYNCTSLENLNMIGVTELGEYAFGSCSSLKSVTIPSGATTIKEGAFNLCEALKSLTIPSSVTSIGKYAFNSCSALEIIVFPSGITELKEGVIANCTSLKSLTIPSSVTSIGYSAIANCKSLEHVTIPPGVETIDKEVFRGCSALKSVTIPSSVTSIGNSTFNGCTSLKYVSIPSSVKSIGDNAFTDCTSLTSISIPYDITYIGTEAFLNCKELEDVFFGKMSSKPTIGNNVFYYGSAFEFYIEGAKYEFKEDIWNKFSDTAFTNKGANALQFDKTPGIEYDRTSPGSKELKVVDNHETKLKNIVIPDETMFENESCKVVEIVANAFENCTTLTSITIPSSVKSIKNNAFSGCSSLETVVMENGIESIGADAFSGCTSLKSITIPSSVKSIDDRAFDGCTDLEEIIFEELDSKLTVGSDVFPTDFAFYFVGDETPYTFNDENKEKFSGKTFVQESTNVYIEVDNLTYEDYTASETTVSGYKKPVDSITIPEKTRKDGVYYTVTSIKEEAFSDLGMLKSITIPSSITSIGDKAFLRCVNLEEMTFGSLDNASIGGHVFSYGISDEPTDFVFYLVDDETPYTFNDENKDKFSNRTFVLKDAYEHSYIEVQDEPTSSVYASFDIGQGIGKVDSIESSAGSKITLPECTGYLEKYAFGGWYYKGTVYQPGEKFKMPSHDVEFTAVWAQYTIKFDSQGGTGVASAKTGTDGKLSCLPSSSKDGYELNGWYTSNGKKVTTGMEFVADTTVYAHWTSVSVPESVTTEESDKTVVVAAIAAACAAACAAFTMVAFLRRD